MTSNFATSSRGNLAEILTTITEQDRSNVDFDIVQSCENRDVVSEMHDQRRDEREAKLYCEIHGLYRTKSKPKYITYSLRLKNRPVLNGQENRSQ